MKQRKTNPKHEYEATLAYYKTTVWEYVRDVSLSGVQLGVALIAWSRLYRAQQDWLDSLSDDERAKALHTELDLLEIRPRWLVQDESVTPELLATVASHRLGTRKPKPLQGAIEEAHELIRAARDYLKALPKQNYPLTMDVECHFPGSVSFDDILKRSGKHNSFPLLQTVQKKRNNGRLTPKALEKALTRYGDRLLGESQQEILEAVKDKKISGKLLEEIRWQRFRDHFKG